MGTTPVTQLLDPPIGSGSTLHPRDRFAFPGVSEAEDFYVRGPRPLRKIEIQVSGPSVSLRHTWLASYMEVQINDLLRLQPGWDGRRAQPPTDAAVGSAVDLLFAVADDLSLPPQVFPLPDGGLQLEWHARASVEIEVDAEGVAHVLTVDQDGTTVLNDELEGSDSALLEKARAAIQQLTIRLARAR